MHPISEERSRPLKLNLLRGRVPLLAALLVASCSQSPSSPTSLAGGKTPDAAALTTEGVVRGQAAGDVNEGPNPINMNLVRVAQTDGLAFYANPEGQYVLTPGLEVEIYVQIWTSNPPVESPRLIVDWGDGERENIHCGPCRLSRTYKTEGSYTVKVIMDDRVSSTTTRTFVLNVQTNVDVAVAGGTFTFSNTGAFTIPAGAPGVTQGAADPYPSTISVSGLAPRLDKVAVTLAGLSHTFSADLVILLVAPNGQTVKLLDRVGGPVDAVNATVTFDDGGAAYPVAAYGPGNFVILPSQAADSAMPAPAPNVADGTTLSSLNGIDPNGTWQLFVFDRERGDSGSISGGWSVTLTAN